MKKWIALLLAATMLFGLAACGGGDDDDSSGGGAEGYKDTLVWAQGADVTSMDPHVGKETPAVAVTVNIFDTLLLKDDDGNPEPHLATEWEQVDDVTWTFKLRDDVYFHDGSQMTAEDVKYSLDRAVASAAVSYIVDFIADVTVDDEFQVTITTHFPYAPILANLAVPFAGIVPKDLVEEQGDDFFLNPIGTGPYKFVEWSQGDYVKMEANYDYFLGEPATQYLQMNVVPEASQRAIAIETGEADIAVDLATNDASRVEDNDDLVFALAPNLSVSYVSMNMNKAPFDNELVRQAVRYAINEEDIILGARNGQGDVANSLIPPAAFGHSTSSMDYEYDPDKAIELLAEAGYPDGFSTTLWVNDNQERIEACTIIQQQLQEVGIEVELSVMEFGTFIDETSDGAHDMAFFAWTCSTADADYNYYSLYHSSQQGSPGNRTFFDNAKADELIELGRATADYDQRQEYYDELEELLGPITPNATIYWYSINAGYTKNVENFNMDPNGYHRMWTVTVAE